LTSHAHTKFIPCEQTEKLQCKYIAASVLLHETNFKTNKKGKAGNKGRDKQ